MTRDARVAENIRAELSNWKMESKSKLTKRLITVLAIQLALTQSSLYKIVTFPSLRYLTIHRSDLVSILGHKKPFRRDQFPKEFERRLSPMQARLALAQLSHVDEDAAQRNHIAGIYRKGLAQIDGLALPSETKDETNIYLSFPVMTQRKRQLMEHMLRHGRDINSFFYKNLADLECFADFLQHCPAARIASESTLLLPIYPGYKDDEVHRNIDVIREYFMQSQVRQVSVSHMTTG